MLLDISVGKTVLTIRDDGIGFDAAAKGAKRHAQGGLLPDSGLAGYCQARLSYVAPGATRPHPSVH